MTAAAHAILPDMPPDCLASPSEWPRWILVRSGDMDDLESVATALRQQLHGPQRELVAARLGHVLMLLSRPREAVMLLTGNETPLGRAQLCLAQVQVLRDEAYNGGPVQKLAERDLALRALLGELPDWLPMHGPLDAEAQMRLHYARLLIHMLLCQHEDAQAEWQRAHYLCEWLGCDMMQQILDGIAAQLSGREAPAQAIATLLAQIRSEAVRAAPLQHRTLAREALTLLLPAAEPDMVQAVAQAAGPDAAWWPDAVAALSGEPERLPPLDTAPNDSLMVLAHSFVAAIQAERLREQRYFPAAKEAALTALRLSGGCVESWGQHSVLQQVFIALAYLSLGMIVELRALLSQLLNLRHATHVVQIYRSALVLHLALHLGVRQADVDRASAELQSALGHLPDLPSQRTMAIGMWRLWPDVTYWTAQQSACAWLGQYAPPYAVYDGDTVKLGGAPLALTPRGAAMRQALSEALGKKAEGLDASERQALRRFRQGLAAAGSPPLVDLRCVERLSEIVNRSAQQWPTGALQ